MIIDGQPRRFTEQQLSEYWGISKNTLILKKAQDSLIKKRLGPKLTIT